MKNRKLFQTQIRQKIQIASDLERVRFGFDICTRLLSDYKAIAEQDFLPDIGVLENSIRFFDNYLEFNLMDPDEDLLLINQVDLIRPFTENLTEAESSCVLNTIACITELLMYLGDNDYHHIFTLSDLMINTIEFQVFDSDDQISQDDVDNHPIFTNEIKHQLELFNK